MSLYFIERTHVERSFVVNPTFSSPSSNKSLFRTIAYLSTHLPHCFLFFFPNHPFSPLLCTIVSLRKPRIIRSPLKVSRHVLWVAAFVYSAVSIDIYCPTRGMVPFLCSKFSSVLFFVNFPADGTTRIAGNLVSLI